MKLPASLPPMKSKPSHPDFDSMSAFLRASPRLYVDLEAA